MPLELADLMDGQNMRVVEGGGHSRFQQEALLHRGLRPFRGEKLDGNTPMQRGVHRPVDNAHTAFAEAGFHTVGTDSKPGSTCGQRAGSGIASLRSCTNITRQRAASARYHCGLSSVNVIWFIASTTP